MDQLVGSKLADRTHLPTLACFVPVKSREHAHSDHSSLRLQIIGMITSPPQSPWSACSASISLLGWYCMYPRISFRWLSSLTAAGVNPERLSLSGSNPRPARVCVLVCLCARVYVCMCMCTSVCSTKQLGLLVQYSTVQYSIAQYSTVQYSTVLYCTVQYSTVQYSTVRQYMCMYVCMCVCACACLYMWLCVFVCVRVRCTTGIHFVCTSWIDETFR